MSTSIPTASALPIRPSSSTSTNEIRWTQAPDLAQARAGLAIGWGHQGPSVEQLQQRLGIDVDGKFGPETDRAVRQFQRAHDCSTDGLVGPETLAALGRVTRPPVAPLHPDRMESREEGAKRDQQARTIGRSPEQEWGPRQEREYGPLNEGAPLVKDADKAASAASWATDRALKIAQAATGKPGVAISRGVGAAASFAGHLLGDQPVAESAAGHVAASLAKTAGDSAVSIAGAGASEAAKKFSGGLLGHLATADNFVAVDNPVKLATTTAAELVPSSQATKAIGGGVDAAVAAANLVTGNEAGAFKQAEQVQEKALNGDYGAVTAALTKGIGMIQDPQATGDKLTDRKAQQGERGLVNAWGNAVADMLTEAFGNPPPSNITKIYGSSDDAE